MGQRPMKIRLLELFDDGQPHWNNEVVAQIFKEYHMGGDYERDLINFDLIELASGGMLADIEQKVDVEGIYKKDFLLHKYVITDFGKEKVANICLTR